MNIKTLQWLNHATEDELAEFALHVISQNERLLEDYLAGPQKTVDPLEWSYVHDVPGGTIVKVTLADLTRLSTAGQTVTGYSWRKISAIKEAQHLYGIDLEDATKLIDNLRGLKLLPLK